MPVASDSFTVYIDGFTIYLYTKVVEWTTALTDHLIFALHSRMFALCFYISRSSIFASLPPELLWHEGSITCVSISS